MKYWLLTTEFPPAHGGGISTYCYFTTQMLSEAGVAVTIFVNDDSVHDLEITEEANGVRTTRFNSNRDGLQQTLGYTARLSYAFAIVVKQMIEQEGKPAFIESQDYLGIAYYLTQFKHAGYPFLSGIPIIITIHSPAFIYLRYNRVPVYRFPDYWTGEMEKQSLIAADALISPTRFMLEEVEKHVLLAGIQNAIIPNPYKADETVTINFERNKIVYYGKLSPQKGSFELLSYFKKLWDDGFTHKLHVIGGTDIVFYPEMKTMGQLVTTQYAEYIKKDLLQLHGKIKPAEINHHLHDAHVIIVPSTVDNMPYVVMEAMSRSKIVLASVQGGQCEMIEDGVNGFLFSHTEPASFGDQLKKILSLPDEAIEQTGKMAAQTIAGRYSYKSIIEKKINFLQDLTSRPADRFPFLYQEKNEALDDGNFILDLLSVVIPYYNMGKYIDDCIGSVMASTYKNIELLIIDDGSTDADSITKLQQLGFQKNIAVISRANHGLAATRNFGATKARGEFLAFLDADDKVAETYYEKGIAALQKNKNVFFAGAWVQYFENSNCVWPAFTPQPPYALLHNPVNSSGLLYKRAAFLAGGLNDKNVDYGMEDYESVVQMLSKGFNGIVLPEILFYYRVRTGSMFRNITRAKLLFSNKYITEKHEKYYASFAGQIINLLNANGPGYLYDNPTFETQVSVSSGPKNMYTNKLKTFIKKNEPLKRLALQLLKIKNKR